MHCSILALVKIVVVEISFAFTALQEIDMCSSSLLWNQPPPPSAPLPSPKCCFSGANKLAQLPRSGLRVDGPEVRSEHNRCVI